MSFKTYWAVLCLFFSSACLIVKADSTNSEIIKQKIIKPEVQLATVYSDTASSVKEYLVSEKYDGVRAIWTGKQLLSKQGNPINAPAWFTESFPNEWLDGELWSQRNDFAFILSTVTKRKPVDSEWRKIKYMIFDVPDTARKLTFEERYIRYKKMIDTLSIPHLVAVQQMNLPSNDALQATLDEYVSKGAEGLILHRKNALFVNGRSDNVLKLKPYMEASAQVIGIQEGTGKYSGMMGSLLVRMPSGIEFKVGSGFSDNERRLPPKIGDWLVYKHHGFTQNGIPRFASFVRLHEKIR